MLGVSVYYIDPGLNLLWKSLNWKLTFVWQKYGKWYVHFGSLLFTSLIRKLKAPYEENEGFKSGSMFTHIV